MRVYLLYVFAVGAGFLILGSPIFAHRGLRLSDIGTKTARRKCLFKKLYSLTAWSFARNPIRMPRYC
jgi:hypothetical protein